MIIQDSEVIDSFINEVASLYNQLHIIKRTSEKIASQADGLHNDLMISVHDACDQNLNFPFEDMKNALDDMISDLEGIKEQAEDLEEGEDPHENALSGHDLLDHYEARYVK